MGPFEAQLREFVRRLDFVEHEVRGHGRKLTAIRQNLRDADDTGIKAKLARISGEVDGCASAGFPGATVAIYHHDTGVKLGELTCDGDGLYAGRVGLDSSPQDVDIVATPVGTYAARFAGPVVTPATLSVGANAVDPIVIPPTADWCCGETDYFPGECEPTCSSLPENLYLESNYWAGKVAFSFDSGSSLWVAGVMVDGNVHDPSGPCEAVVNIGQTAMIYQMNTSGFLTRRVDAIAVIPMPSTKCVENSMPGSLTSTTPFGPSSGFVGVCDRGTLSQGKSVTCTCCPLELKATNLTNAPGFATETLTITATP